MRKEKKYNYFYIIVNRLNGSYYKGVHSTDDLDDGYMGSGKKLQSLYNEFGTENFEKTILKFFPTAAEMFDYEREQVTLEETRNPQCYNIAIGGYGGNLMAGLSEEELDDWRKKINTPERSRKISNTLRGHSISEETRIKISLSLKGNPGHNRMIIIVSDTMPVKTRMKYSITAGDRFDCIADLHRIHNVGHHVSRRWLQKGWIIKI